MEILRRFKNDNGRANAGIDQSGNMAIGVVLATIAVVILIGVTTTFFVPAQRTIDDASTQSIQKQNDSIINQ